MKKSAFIKNFPLGMSVPPLLLKLLKFQEQLDEPYSGYFWLTDLGREMSLGYFDKDKKAASQFVFFGRNPDDSAYGFWLYEGRDLARAPIVFCGSEGTGCTVLANSLEEFFALLSCGEDELGFAAPYISDAAEVSEGLLAFREWLQKSLGIAHPTDPDSIVLKAKGDHPDLQKWLENWQKSHFGT